MGGSERSGESGGKGSINEMGMGRNVAWIGRDVQVDCRKNESESGVDGQKRKDRLEEIQKGFISVTGSTLLS